MVYYKIKPYQNILHFSSTLCWFLFMGSPNPAYVRGVGNILNSFGSLEHLAVRQCTGPVLQGQARTLGKEGALEGGENTGLEDSRSGFQLPGSFVANQPCDTGQLLAFLPVKGGYELNNLKGLSSLMMGTMVCAQSPPLHMPTELKSIGSRDLFLIMSRADVHSLRLLLKGIKVSWSWMGPCEMSQCKNGDLCSNTGSSVCAGSWSFPQRRHVQCHFETVSQIGRTSNSGERSSVHQAMCSKLHTGNEE